jgi:hypothetical protein
LKQNEPALTYTNLKKMVILFAMFGNNEYVETLLLHLHLFEYQLSIDHPHVDLFMKNLYNLVGEDIELGNRALSHCSVRNARRGAIDLLDKAYRMLRFLRNAGVQFGEDMYEYRDIKKGTRRYDVDDDKTLPIFRMVPLLITPSPINTKQDLKGYVVSERGDVKKFLSFKVVMSIKK